MKKEQIMDILIAVTIFTLQNSNSEHASTIEAIWLILVILIILK